jgi:hypothetical protein
MPPRKKKKNNKSSLPDIFEEANPVVVNKIIKNVDNNRLAASNMLPPPSLGPAASNAVTYHLGVLPPDAFSPPFPSPLLQPSPTPNPNPPNDNLSTTIWSPLPQPNVSTLAGSAEADGNTQDQLRQHIQTHITKPYPPALQPLPPSSSASDRGSLTSNQESQVLNELMKSFKEGTVYRSSDGNMFSDGSLDGKILGLILSEADRFARFQLKTSASLQKGKYIEFKGVMYEDKKCIKVRSSLVRCRRC